MAGVRFEDVDLLGALSRIVDLHTQHYKEDFDLDITPLRNLYPA